jgi:hypothetical protein
MAKTQMLDRFRNPPRFIPVRGERFPLRDVAEGAESGADGPEDQECSLSAAIAFRNVGAMGLSADGVEPETVEEHVHVAMGRRGDLFPEPLGTAGQVHLSSM